MERRAMIIGVAALVFAVGCDKSEPASADAPAAESKSESAEKNEKADPKDRFKAAKEAAKIAAESGSTAAEGLGEAAGGKKNWEFSIDGVDLPTVSGGMVMTQTIGDTVSYKMAGVGAMHTITLKGVKKHQTGEFDPYVVQLLWTDQQFSCSSNKNEDAAPKVTIEKKGDGIRGEISGKVFCRHVKEGSADNGKVAKVKGYFID